MDKYYTKYKTVDEVKQAEYSDLLEEYVRVSKARFDSRIAEELGLSCDDARLYETLLIISMRRRFAKDFGLVREIEAEDSRKVHAETNAELERRIKDLERQLGGHHRFFGGMSR